MCLSALLWPPSFGAACAGWAVGLCRTINAANEDERTERTSAILRCVFCLQVRYVNLAPVDLSSVFPQASCITGMPV